MKNSDCTRHRRARILLHLSQNSNVPHSGMRILLQCSGMSTIQQKSRILRKLPDQDPPGQRGVFTLTEHTQHTSAISI